MDLCIPFVESIDESLRHLMTISNFAAIVFIENEICLNYWLGTVSEEQQLVEVSENAIDESKKHQRQTIQKMISFFLLLRSLLRHFVPALLVVISNDQISSNVRIQIRLSNTMNACKNSRRPRNKEKRNSCKKRMNWKPQCNQRSKQRAFFAFSLALLAFITESHPKPTHSAVPIYVKLCCTASEINFYFFPRSAHFLTFAYFLFNNNGTTYISSALTMARVTSTYQTESRVRQLLAIEQFVRAALFPATFSVVFRCPLFAASYSFPKRFYSAHWMHLPCGDMQCKWTKCNGRCLAVFPNISISISLISFVRRPGLGGQEGTKIVFNAVSALER